MKKLLKKFGLRPKHETPPLVKKFSKTRESRSEVGLGILEDFLSFVKIDPDTFDIADMRIRSVRGAELVLCQVQESPRVFSCVFEVKNVF